MAVCHFQSYHAYNSSYIFFTINLNPVVISHKDLEEKLQRIKTLLLAYINKVNRKVSIALLGDPVNIESLLFWVKSVDRYQAAVGSEIVLAFLVE